MFQFLLGIVLAQTDTSTVLTTLTDTSTVSTTFTTGTFTTLSGTNDFTTTLGTATGAATPSTSTTTTNTGTTTTIGNIPTITGSAITTNVPSTTGATNTVSDTISGTTVTSTPTTNPNFYLDPNASLTFNTTSDYVTLLNTTVLNVIGSGSIVYSVDYISCSGILVQTCIWGECLATNTFSQKLLTNQSVYISMPSNCWNSSQNIRFGASNGIDSISGIVVNLNYVPNNITRLNFTLSFVATSAISAHPAVVRVYRNVVFFRPAEADTRMFCFKLNDDGTLGVQQTIALQYTATNSDWLFFKHPTKGLYLVVTGQEGSNFTLEGLFNGIAPAWVSLASTMDPVYLDPFPMPRFCYLDYQHAMLYVTSDKITRYNILDPANPIYISQQRLGDYQPNGQAISVAPAGVFVITTTIGGVYGIGQWNVSDPEMPWVGKFFPNSQYGSVWSDNRFPNNRLLNVGPNTNAPMGILNPDTGKIVSNYTKPGPCNFNAIHGYYFNGQKYVAYLYCGKYVYFYNASDPSQLLGAERLLIPGSSWVTDFTIYKDWLLSCDFGNYAIRAFKLRTPWSGFTWEVDTESQYDMKNPMILHPASTLTLSCTTAPSLLTTATMNVLDTSYIDHSNVMPNQYFISAYSCPGILIQKCTTTCTNLTVTQYFLQSDLENGRIFVSMPLFCYTRYPSITFDFSNNMMGDVKGIQVLLSAPGYNRTADSALNFTAVPPTRVSSTSRTSTYSSSSSSISSTVSTSSLVTPSTSSTSSSSQVLTQSSMSSYTSPTTANNGASKIQINWLSVFVMLAFI